MNQTLRHRGPDDEGYHTDRNLGMGMKRLSIIDVSGGKQPIHNEDRTIWIIFNGEIFNYRDLREFVSKKGHQFYTSSDTETIVHLYEEFGEDCVNYLRGMFAFAIWDSRFRTLLIFRDRMGIKPLFYSMLRNEEILFASEQKALTISEDLNTEMDLQALDAYFAYGYIPSPLSIYQGIRKLPAGHLIRVNERAVTIRKYWDLYFRPDYSKSEAYFRERVEEIFSESVNMRLLSEVPLGAFLSGGVDSSLVVAYMANSMKNAPKTFTVGFSGNTGGYLDERPYARMLADKYKCDHHEIEIEPKVDIILEELVNAFDEPFSDDSIIPSYYICKASKKDVTVALTGLGGDELFAGYERYLGFHLSLLFDWVPGVITKNVMPPMIGMMQELKSGHYTVNHIKRFIRALHKPMAERYLDYITILGPEARASVYNGDISGQIDYEATRELMTQYFNSEDNAMNPMDKMFYQDIKTYLAEDILALTDRIGMMHSQELRVPFTDHILVEMCATIPAEMKIKHFQKKALLMSIARNKIPMEVLSHRKQGFSSPMAQWLKGDLKLFAKDILSKEIIRNGGVLNSVAVNKIVDDHLSRKELNDKILFALIMFQKWRQNTPHSK